MTTRNGRNGIRFVCDDCGVEYDTMTSDFRDGLDDAKSDGWVARQEDGEWRHYCEDCK